MMKRTAHLVAATGSAFSALFFARGRPLREALGQIFSNPEKSNYVGADMFRATFAFLTSYGVSGLQIDALACEDRAGVDLIFRVKDSEDAPYRDINTGRLVGCTPWSEPPLALLLRALHWLRVEWFSSIPAVLTSHPIRDLNLSVQHLTKNGLSGTMLASFALAKVGYEEEYRLRQSLPNKSLFNVEIDVWSAIPLGAALKAVAQVQLESIDLHTAPTAVKVSVLTASDGRRHVLREHIPHFALPAFEAYRKEFHPSRNTSANSRYDELLIPAHEWTNFLAA